MMKTRAISALVASTLLAVAGCGGGPKLYPVTGTITMNGEPLADAAVQFLPNSTDGSALPAEGMTGPDGKYTLLTGAESGAAAGTYQVAVTKAGDVSSSAFPDDPSMALMAPDGAGAKKKKATKGGPIEYTETEPAEVVSNGPNVIDVDVKVKDEPKP